MDEACLLSGESLKKHLKTSVFGKTFRLLDETGSTNRICYEMAQQGLPSGAVVAAINQTDGRGRFDRKWKSLSGGLWFSLLIRPRVRQNPSPFTVICGSSVAKALQIYPGIDSSFHWPNDIYAGEKKLGGILISTRFTGESPDFIIAGIGINCNYPAESIGHGMASPATTLLDLSGSPVDLNRLLAEILLSLETAWQAFESSGPGPLMKEANKNCMTLGRRILVMESEDNSFEATALDLKENGDLAVKNEDGSIISIHNAHRIKLL